MDKAADFYFELTVLDSGPMIIIGLGTSDFGLKVKVLGSEDKSIGMLHNGQVNKAGSGWEKYG